MTGDISARASVAPDYNDEPAYEPPPPPPRREYRRYHRRRFYYPVPLPVLSLRLIEA